MFTVNCLTDKICVPSVLSVKQVIKTKTTLKISINSQGLVDT